ncbi:MAG: DUF3800 domain-containing protein [Solirubrobacterales bacterium]
MQLCYLDESGDPYALSRASDQSCPPVFVLGGVTFDAEALKPVTRELVKLKSDLKPEARLLHEHDYLKALLPELKGSNLRKIVRTHGSKDGSALAMSALDETLSILERHDATIVGFIHDRNVDENAAGERAYNRAVKHVCKAFDNRLSSENDFGLVIADNRDDKRNRELSHEIYVQKFRDGDRLPRIVEAPMFGQSENHAGLQLADIVCSAFLAAKAAGEKVIDEHFGPRVKRLQQDVLRA